MGAGPRAAGDGERRSREKLSVFVISYNRSPLLRACLSALAFADEIVVVDKSSTDDSVAVAAELADRVLTVPWSPTVEETRGFALAQCSHEWVLYLDDDECLSPEAVIFIDAELRAPRADIYVIPLRHYILGRHDERAYYWPEAHARLFRRAAVSFRETVHAGIVPLSERRFEVPVETGACIHHLSHRDTAEWIAKTNRYTSRPDRDRAPHDEPDLIGFAHARLDHWRVATSGSDGSDYPAAVAVLRAVYDMVDRVKAWEQDAGLDGAASFARVAAELEQAYAERLGHLRRPRRKLAPPPADARGQPGAEPGAAELDAMRAELEAIRASTFWRVTGPLRWAIERARAAGRRLTPHPTLWLRAGLSHLNPRSERNPSWPGLTRPSVGIVAALETWRAQSGSRQRLTDGRVKPGHDDRETGSAKCQVPPPEDIRFPTAAAPVVSVIIPTFGKVDYTLGCLAAMARHLPAAPIEVLVVDDASPDPATAALARVRGIRLVTNATNLGFLRSCNAAARAAAGGFVLFLNNDTEVRAGWLDPMVALMAVRPDAGAVGSMLLFPDGRLQEAGGIVWQDCTGWNFGRGDDPDEPKYNYVREVDYISGASLLVRRDLFAALGGFDEAFAPAYCEDADLAFRIRAAGFKVLYQPLSRVVHFEGISNGTDPTRGIKRFNAINRHKLVARWSDVLAAENYPHGEQVLRARERGRHRRLLLVLAETVASGGELASALAAGGAMVKLWASDPSGPGALRQRGVDVLGGGAATGLWAWLERHGAAIDEVVVADAWASQALLPDLRGRTSAPVLYPAPVDGSRNSGPDQLPMPAGDRRFATAARNRREAA